MGRSVLLLATVDTKREAVEYFTETMSKHGIRCRVLDLSLHADGEVWSGPRKLQEMSDVAHNTAMLARDAIEAGVVAAVAIGGGTGGEIALQVMRGLPFAFPKMLVTTLPFDPRYAVADNAITIVPSLADVCGLNQALRQVLENAAAMLAGLCNTATKLSHVSDIQSVGITALGATGAAADELAHALNDQGHEATVFHANGFGGAAFARFARCGTFHTVVDLTCHELTRKHVAGVGVQMPDRFTAARDAGVPQVILPGGLNFIGLGELALIPEQFRRRGHYQHSGFFTHVQVTENEMALVAGKLVEALNPATAPVTVLVPMGGFSHQDKPGGPIEAPELRDVFWQIISSQLESHIELIRLESHICAPETTTAIMDAVKPHLPTLSGSPSQDTVLQGSKNVRENA
ncbi:MAG: Tm-1-like ATP-binding domain-containing protein [Pseudomonadota bacterium]